MLLNLTGALLSLAWLGLCLWYLEGAVGLGQVPYLLPHEVGQFLTGALLPLVLLWLLIGQRHLAGRVARLEAGATAGRQQKERDEPRVGKPALAADDGGEERMPRLRVAREPEAD